MMGKPGNTPAQVAQRERAWRIFRLRSLAVMALILTKARADQVEAIIDDELRELGAERTADHRAKQAETPPKRRKSLSPFPF